MISHYDALAAAESLLRGLRDDIRAEFSRLHDTSITLKQGIGNLANPYDERLEALLADLLPSLGLGNIILGEELVSGREACGWIVDPIDGTQNFVHGFPSYAVSLALVDQHKIAAGLVYDVERDEAFTAVAGGAAYLNGTSLAPSACDSIEAALLATGRPYDPARTKCFIDRVAYFAPIAQGIRIKGPASLDICYVACGRLDAYIEDGLQPWDYAAAALIAECAGVVVAGAALDNEGHPLGCFAHTESDRLIAAAPLLSDELVARLDQLEVACREAVYTPEVAND